MMKIYKYAAISLLLASCTVVAGDTPLEKGKTYYLNGPNKAVKVQSIKGNWILVSDKKACGYSIGRGDLIYADQCWINTNMVNKAIEIK